MLGAQGLPDGVGVLTLGFLLAIYAIVAAIWVASAIPPIAIPTVAIPTVAIPTKAFPLRRRSTIADLVREITHPDFLLPVAAESEPACEPECEPGAASAWQETDVDEHAGRCCC